MVPEVFGADYIRTVEVLEAVGIESDATPNLGRVCGEQVPEGDASGNGNLATPPEATSASSAIRASKFMVPWSNG